MDAPRHALAQEGRLKRSVYLHGRLGSKFGKRFELDVDTPAEAFRALGFQLPGFRSYVEQRQYQVTAGEVLLDQEALNLRLGAGRDVHVVPAGLVSGIETILLVGTLLFTAVAAVGVLMMPRAPSATSREDATKTASFMFDGPQNRTEQGHVIPLVYGDFKVGSLVASAGLSTTDVTEANISPGSGRVDGTGVDPMFMGSTAGVGGSVHGDEWVNFAKGGKSSGGSARAAQEDPNSLQSQATARIIDLVSEGEIVGLVDGLKSVYFDETPLQNADGSFNFAGVSVEQRVGLAHQDWMPGFTQVESSREINTKVTVNLGPVTRTVEDPDATVARVTIRLPQLYQQDTTNGDMKTTSVSVKISVQVDGGGFTDVIPEAVFNGKTTSGYQRTYDVRLPEGDVRQVRVTRLTPDSTVTSLANETDWDILTEVVEAKLIYPDSALFGLTVDARQFGTNIPNRSYHIKGLIIEVPSNYDPVARTYTGMWDGTFKRAWSNNGAWVFRDIIVNDRYGLGKRVPASAVDKWTLYAIAQYNDGLVPDGVGGMQPRHTLNCCIQDEASAYDVLAAIASSFRGWAYWGSGSIVAVQDRPEDPSILVTRANVVDGNFAYTRVTSLEARRSVGIVYWNDPTDGFKLTPEFHEDPDLIRRLGRKPGQAVSGFGITNRGEAVRMARWLLEDESPGSNTSVSYAVGDDHGFIEPGRIAQVADPKYTLARRGGRVRAADANSVTLDAPFTFVAGQAFTLQVTLPDGTVSKRVVTNAAGTTSAVVALGGAAYAASPLAGAVWTLESNTVVNRQFRIRNIAANEPPYDLKAVLHDPTKYDRVELGIDLSPANFMELPSGPLEVPSGLNAIEFLLRDGTASVPSVQFAWNAPRDPRLIFFQAQYKRPSGDRWEPLVDSLDVSREVRNSEAGDWGLRVRSLDALGNKTAWTQATFTLDGRVDLLPEVEAPSLLINADAFIAKLIWLRPPDTRPLRFEVLYSNVNNLAGATSLGATDQVEFAVSLPGFYWVRTVFINAISPAPEAVEVSADAIGFLGDFGALATRDTVQIGAGGQVRREDGTTPLTDASTVTALGTAAAIMSQGALATASQVNLGASGRVYREDGSTRLTDALAVTSLGTASAIASQGALATQSQVYFDGGFIKEAAGGADASLANFKTVLGTASAISGQGVLATLSRVILGSSGQVYREDGATRLTDATAVTSLGTASAIAGQGAFATVSSAAYGSSYLTGFGTLAPRNNVRIANELVRADGTTATTDAMLVTSLGTASAIASQGALATANQVNWGSTGRVYRDDGVTRVTDASSITSLGTAAAISGQGAFATVSSAAYGSSFLTGFGTLAPRNNVRIANELVRADGTTATTDAMLVTSLGTASAIASQGAFATVSSAAYGSSLLTGFGTLAPRNNVRLANEVYRADGSTLLTDALAVTSLGTASAIAGQGALATLSAADYASQVSGATKPESNATRNVADRALNRNSSLQDLVGWTNPYAGSATVAASASSVRGGTVATLVAGAGLRSEQVPCTPGEVLWFVYRFATTANRTGGVSPTWYVGIEWATAIGAATTSSTDAFAATAIAVAAGVQSSAGTSVTVPAGIYAADIRFVIDLGNAGSGATGYVDYAEVHRDQPGSTVGSIFGSNAYRADGATLVTDATAITSLGTASAIASQGALATLSSVQWGSSGRVYRDDGVTRVTDASSVTSLGTAAAIASQGSFATLSQTYFGDGLLKETSGGATATLANFKTSSGTAASIASQGALATRNTARLGTEVYRADGTTVLTDALAVTSLGTASAIAGQGALATLSSADYATQIGGSAKPENNATRNSQARAVNDNSEFGLWDGSVALRWSTVAYSRTGTITRVANSANSTRGTDNIQFAGGAGATGTSRYGDAVPVSVGEVWYVEGRYLTTANGSGTPTWYVGADGVAYTGTATAGYYTDGTATGIAGPVNLTVAGGAKVFKFKITVPAGAVALRPVILLDGAGSTGEVDYLALYRDEPGATVGSIFNLNAYRNDGSTLVTDATSITSLGTAAAIAAQGALATLNSADLEGSTVINKTRISKLAPATGVASDSSILPANTLYGLIPALKATVTISDTDNTGTVTLNIGSAIFYPDAGGTITFPSGSLAGKAYNTTYFIKRTGVDPVSAPTGTAWSASTSLTIAVGDVYINSYTTRATGGTPSPPPPPPPGGGSGGGGVYLP